MSTPDWREAHDAGWDSGYAAGRAEAGELRAEIICDVSELTLQGGKRDESEKPASPPPAAPPPEKDLDDDIPF